MSEGLVPILFENHGLTSIPMTGAEGRWGYHFIQLDAISVNKGNVSFTYRDYGNPGQDNNRTKKQFSHGLKAVCMPVRR